MAKRGEGKGAPDWSAIEASGKVGGKVSGESEGAEGKGKAEGQRLKGISTQRVRQAKQYLETVSPAQLGNMLTGSSKTLTPKQRAYAYNVAQGATKAAAYRQAYKQDAAPATIGHEPYRLAADPRIAAEIEAYKLAAAAAKHRTAEDLRALVIQTLVQQVIDPECPPAVRTQAAKTLGNVTEVAAFTERRESVVHHSSDAIRQKIMGELQTLMAGKTVEGEIVAQDAVSLLDELARSRTPEFTPESPDHAGPSLDAQDADDSDTPNAK